MSAARLERLSAWIVNYQSGAYALRCARSLRREWAAAGRADGALEILVVDNASPDDQTTWLAALQAEGARVLHAGRNGGYAAGIELARARASASDAVALLNPDLLFLPGSVAALLAALGRERDVGAVGPRTWLDEQRGLQLPPIPLPAPREHALDALAELCPARARGRADARARRAVAAWSARGPFETEMLSGACVFLRRAVADALPRLLDPRYPLYFEDADLSRRLRARGLRLVLEPRAEVAHHWSRSVGPGAGASGDPARRYGVSRALYLAQHFGQLGLARDRRLAQLFVRAGPARRGRAWREVHELGEHATAPRWRLEAPCEHVLQVALSPTFGLAAGCFGAGQELALPAGAWRWMHPGRLYLRVLERESLAELGVWSATKTSAARDAEDAPDADRRAA